MYKEGIRWTECMETFGRTDITYMVLDYNLNIFMITKINLVIIIIIISQVLGHTNFNKNGQLANSMNLLSMNEVKTISLVISPR